MPAEISNTGPGGFGINGQQELFDVGLPEPKNPKSPYGAYLRKVDADGGFLNDQGQPKDLTTVTKTTLSHFLSNTTMGSSQGVGNTPVPNDYPVQSGYVVAPITDANGYPAVQTPAGYAPLNNPSFAPKPSEISALSNNFSSISPPLKKGKAAFKGTGGNDLLAGVAGTVDYTAQDGILTGNSPVSAPGPISGHPASDAIIAPYISKILGSNRFTNAASAYSLSPSGNAGFNPNLTQQKVMGVYNPAAPTVNTDQLATVGPLLSMRAGLSLGANDAGADPNGSSLQAGALLPGLGQLGVTQIDPNTLFAAGILNQLTTDALDSTDVLSIGTDSWGHLNNPDDPYSGTDAVGMLTLALALVAGMELLFAGLDIILGLITPSVKQPTHDAQGRYTLGQYFAGQKPQNPSSGPLGALSALASLNFGALLGIQPTTFPFATALSNGTNAFFQLPLPTGGIGISLSLPGTASMDSPGYYSIVARAIIRSGIVIVTQLENIGGNIMSAINAILALIDVIRSSTLVSAINIFAGLGDAILTQPKAWSDPDDPTGTKVSFSDSMSNDIPASAVVKNRLQGSLKLAWASNTADANMLLPSAFIVANAMSTGLGQFSPFIGIPRDPYSYVQSTVVNSTDYGRIDSVTAQTFEQQLESQYVPFYFHDVRTNEMISFHAFIAGITDDYTAAYNKSEGFGRVEPVKIYKNTERKISLSFYIAATSPNDFDDMWVKINKLVTLVYPQYTQGTQVSSADGTSYVFTQPFSQLVGASPMVRIRLGDLFRSNYTPFALGRLFGLGNTGFTIDSNPFLGGDALTTSDLDSLQAALQTALANPAGLTFLPAPGVYPTYVAPSGGGLSISLPSPFGGPSPPTNASQFRPDGAYFEITATDTVDGSPNLIYGTVGLRTDPSFVAWFTANQTALTAKYTSTDDFFNNVIGGTYVFPVSSLIPTADTLSQLGAKSSGLGSAISVNSSLATSLATFLNPNDNAIAKSFQDTGGKGLAGFIETMHFDWYDKVTWETELGRIAPKIVKVTIGFSPIHDISPGIDHMGFNRAPVYPVGIMGHDDVPVTPITSA